METTCCQVLKSTLSVLSLGRGTLGHPLAPTPAAVSFVAEAVRSTRADVAGSGLALNVSFQRPFLHIVASPVEMPIHVFAMYLSVIHPLFLCWLAGEAWWAEQQAMAFPFRGHARQVLMTRCYRLRRPALLALCPS